jgi:hypothetical protein
MMVLIYPPIDISKWNSDKMMKGEGAFLLIDGLQTIRVQAAS